MYRASVTFGMDIKRSSKPRACCSVQFSSTYATISLEFASADRFIAALTATNVNVPIISRQPTVMLIAVKLMRR